MRVCVCVCGIGDSQAYICLRECEFLLLHWLECVLLCVMACTSRYRHMCVYTSAAPCRGCICAGVRLSLFLVSLNTPEGLV